MSEKAPERNPIDETMFRAPVEQSLAAAFLGSSGHSTARIPTKPPIVVKAATTAEMSQAAAHFEIFGCSCLTRGKGTFNGSSGNENADRCRKAHQPGNVEAALDLLLLARFRLPDTSHSGFLGLAESSSSGHRAAELHSVAELLKHITLTPLSGRRTVQKTS